MSFSPTLAALPLDLLTDSLLPLLPASDLVHLSASSRAFRHLINGPNGESIWRTKACGEYGFPKLSSGRRTGWRGLYRQLSGSSAYLWGENGNGRLGISSHSHSQTARKLLLGGGLPLPTQLSLPAPPVALTATGFGFSALTPKGELLIWGTLDGSTYALNRASLSHPGVETPPRLAPKRVAAGLGQLRQVEAGRKHLVLLNTRGEVWEMRAWGRATKIVDDEGRWGVGAGGGNEVAQVEGGWEHSVALTASGAAYIWWEPGHALVTRLANGAGENDGQGEGVSFEVRTPTVRLPALPTACSSKEAEEKVVLLSSGDQFVLALSDKGAVYHLDVSPVPDRAQPAQPAGARGDGEDSPVMSRASRERLESAFGTGQRAWVRMDLFSDLADDKLGSAWEAAGVDRPHAETRISHVSAHFNSFVVYAVPPTDDPNGSYILLGDAGWTPSSVPQILPELQHKGVIKVAQGDYHKLALTSSGDLYAWGAYSGGALGLGHPQLEGTALSVMESETPAPGTIRPRVQQIRAPPERVDHPTRVKFRSETKRGEAGKKFVFAIAANGWHSGALAVDAQRDSPDAVEAERSEDEPTIEQNETREPSIAQHDNTPPPGWAAEDGGRAGGGPGVQQPVGPGLGTRGFPYPFRVGLAGRGRMPRGAYHPPPRPDQ